MINTVNRVFIYFFCTLFFVATGCYAYWQEICFLMAPVCLITAILLIQYPHYLFYLLVMAIPWSVEFNFNPTLGTDLPDEPVMLLCAFTVLLYALYQRKNFHFTKLHPLLAIIALQFLWTIIAVVSSTDIFLSIKYLLAKGWYLLSFLALPLILFRNEKVLRKSVLLLLGSTMVVMIVVLIRHAGNDWTFEKVNDAVRPFFRNHVNYSALLIFMVPLHVAIINLYSSNKVRGIFYGLLLITCIAIYFSYARGAWLAFVAGVAAYWLLRKRLLVFGFLFFLCITIAGVFYLKSNDRFVKFSNNYKSTIFHSDFREHLVATYQLKDLSNAERIYRWIAGVRMVKDYWKTGSGPSTFFHQYKSYTLPAFKTYVSDNREQSTVHNYFLLVLIEQGIMGAMLFIVLITALFWYVQKVYSRAKEKFWRVVVSAAASVLVMQCVINFLSDMIETDKAGSVFYLCVATVIIADLKTKKEQSNPSANIESVS